MYMHGLSNKHIMWGKFKKFRDWPSKAKLRQMSYISTCTKNTHLKEIHFSIWDIYDLKAAEYTPRTLVYSIAFSSCSDAHEAFFLSFFFQHSKKKSQGLLKVWRGGWGARWVLQLFDLLVLQKLLFSLVCRCIPTSSWPKFDVMSYFSLISVLISGEKNSSDRSARSTVYLYNRTLGMKETVYWNRLEFWIHCAMIGNSCPFISHCKLLISLWGCIL